MLHHPFGVFPLALHGYDVERRFIATYSRLNWLLLPYIDDDAKRFRRERCERKKNIAFRRILIATY